MTSEFIFRTKPKRASRRVLVAQHLIDQDAARTRAALLAALEALLAWGQDHTSPLDPNSPHLLLIQAQAAIAQAKGGKP